MNNLGVDRLADNRNMGKSLFTNQREITKSSNNRFFTQIGMFVLIIVLIIIVTTVSILAYEKANNNQSLVDLNNIRDLTLSTLTVENDSSLKTLTLTGDTTSSGGVSVSEGLSVSGKANLYDDLTVSGTATFDNVAGLSVSQLATFHEGISVSGSTTFHGGISVSGITTIEQAKIKKDNIIMTNILPGISTGYILDLDKTGNTYVILNKNSDGVSVPNSFILPTLTGATENGARYKFLWSGDNLSESHKHFTIQTDMSNNLYGTVITARQGSSVITMASNSTTEGVHGVPGTSTTQFHYDGTLYPGSRLECTYLDNNWVLDGSLGTSSDYTTNNGFIDLHNPGWLAAGVSKNAVHNTYLLSSFNGSHYYPVNVQYQKTPYFLNLASGVSGDNTDITTGVGVGTSNNGLGFLYSSNGVSWKSGTGAGQNLQGYGIAYGSSSGTSVWIATGINADGNNILYSTDGISWREGTGLDLDTGKTVGYGLSSDGTSIWVAGGQESNGKNLLYSSDGISWQNSTGSSFGSDGTIETVAYGLSSDRTSIWLAGGSRSGNNILYSDDGVSWRLTTGANINDYVKDIAFGLSSDGTSLWVATGYDAGSGKNIIYSTDGVSWENSPDTPFGTYGFGNKVAFGKDNDDSNLWVAGGFNYDHNGKNILTSTDGKNWSAITSGDSMIINGIQALAYTEPLYPNHDNPVEN